MAQQQDITDVVLKAAAIVEKEVDKRLDELKDVDDMAALRAKRLAILKKQSENRQRWIQAGHGKLNEIFEEKDFFAQTKECEKGVVQFHTPTNIYSDQLRQHLQKLSELHIEVKFMIINAEKCPFLVERLGIRVIPTLLFVEKGKTAGKVEGLDFFGGVKMTTYKIEKSLHKMKFFEDMKLENPDEEEEDDYEDY